MGIETRERRIGDHAYRVTQFGAKQGRKLFVRIVKLVGPSFGAALSSLAQGKTGEFETAIAVGMSRGMYELAERLTEDEFGSVLDDFAKHTVVVIGEKEPRLSDVFDQHFAGRYDEMLAWAGFCVECNYGSFFADSSVAGRMIGRLKAAWLASPSPSTSIGTSTGSPRAPGIATAS